MSYARREKRIDLGKLIRGQRDVKSTEIVFEITEALGVGDRDDVLALSQHPGERKLCRRAILPLRKVFQMGCKLKIMIKGLTLEARNRSPKIICSNVGCLLDRPRQKVSPERTVCYKPDAELAARRERSFLFTSRDQSEYSL